MKMLDHAQASGQGRQLHRLLHTSTTSVLDMTSNNMNSEASVILELCRMQSTSSLPSLPGPLWLGVVGPDRVLSMSQIELNCVITLK